MFSNLLEKNIAMNVAFKWPKDHGRRDWSRHLRILILFRPIEFTALLDLSLVLERFRDWSGAVPLTSDCVLSSMCVIR